MLSRNPEGQLCLEDGEGLVVLDMEDAVSPRVESGRGASKQKTDLPLDGL